MPRCRSTPHGTPTTTLPTITIPANTASPLGLALAVAVALARPRTRTRSTYQHGVLPAPTVRRGGSGAVEVRGCGVP